MNITKPEKKLSLPVSDLFELLMSGEFDQNFYLFLRSDIGVNPAKPNDDGDSIGRHYVTQMKGKYTNQLAWQRAARSMFQTYAANVHGITQAKFMSEFIGNITPDQNEHLLCKIIMAIKEHFGSEFNFNPFAYHVTLESNLESIKEIGIEPRMGERSERLGEPKPLVYLFPTLGDVETALMNWLGEEFDEVYGDNCRIAILKVDVSGVNVESVVDYEVTTHETIHPNYIYRVLNDFEAGFTINAGAPICP